MDSIDLQKRIRRWVETRLGVKAMKPHERAMRMLEEAIELAQSCGVNVDEATVLVWDVFGKPIGDAAQEIGGAMLTLLACADGSGYVASECALTEMRRIENLDPDKFRKRQQLNAERGIGAPIE